MTKQRQVEEEDEGDNEVESARLDTLYLVVHVRMVHVILLTRLLILSMRLLILLLTPWIPLLSVVKVPNLTVLHLTVLSMPN